MSKTPIYQEVAENFDIERVNRALQILFPGSTHDAMETVKYLLEEMKLRGHDNLSTACIRIDSRGPKTLFSFDCRSKPRSVVLRAWRASGSSGE